MKCRSVRKWAVSLLEHKFNGLMGLNSVQGSSLNTHCTQSKVNPHEDTGHGNEGPVRPRDVRHPAYRQVFEAVAVT